MDSASLGRYLVFFAKFEYSLIRAGFLKDGRKVSDDSSIRAVISDWDKFIDNLPQDFYATIKNNPAIQEIFKDGGPRIWARQGINPARFYSDAPITDAYSLIYACKHVRNNVVHGEKLETDVSSIRRNQKLLEETETILTSAIGNVNIVDGFEHISAIYRDVDHAIP